MITKNELQEESKRLAIVYASLSQMIIDINNKIAKYNELVKYANNKIVVNNKNSTLKFTEGYFSPSKNEITVYQFTDDVKLKRVLAHELGHALGIDHNDNVDSIMNELNNSNTFALSNEDKVALKDVCGK